MAENSSNIKERVLQLAEYVGVSKEKFFEEIGVSYGNFKGKSKESSLGANVLADISTIYPNANLEWLITGKGEILKGENSKTPIDTITTKKNGAELSGSVTIQLSITDPNQVKEILKVFGKVF